MLQIGRSKRGIVKAGRISSRQGIKQYKKSISVQIDLCELVGYEYQTSIIYTAYVSSFRKEIAKGGRYNAYKTNKTQYREATGFSLDLKDIFDLSLTRELI